MDASDTSRSISWRQARTLVRQLAAGLRAAGLKDGDCVCLHSFNDVCTPTQDNLFFLRISAYISTRSITASLC